MALTNTVGEYNARGRRRVVFFRLRFPTRVGAEFAVSSPLVVRRNRVGAYCEVSIGAVCSAGDRDQTPVDTNFLSLDFPPLLFKSVQLGFFFL